VNDFEPERRYSGVERLRSMRVGKDCRPPVRTCLTYHPAMLNPTIAAREHTVSTDASPAPGLENPLLVRVRSTRPGRGDRRARAAAQKRIWPRARWRLPSAENLRRVLPHGRLPPALDRYLDD